jgi:hypothetical protein
VTLQKLSKNLCRSVSLNVTSSLASDRERLDRVPACTPIPLWIGKDEPCAGCRLPLTGRAGKKREGTRYLAQMMLMPQTLNLEDLHT